MNDGRTIIHPFVKQLPTVEPRLARLNYVVHQMLQGIDVRTPEEVAYYEKELRARQGHDDDTD